MSLQQNCETLTQHVKNDEEEMKQNEIYSFNLNTLVVCESFCNVK